jgi:hypothetical protein
MSRRPFLDVFSSALPRPPSAAEPLTPPLAFRVGPPPGPGPAGGRAGLLPIHGRLAGAGRTGAGPRAGSGPRAGPGPGRLALRGFRRQAGGGGCGASRLRDTGLRPHRSHPHGSSCRCVCLLQCVSCLVVLARAPRSRRGRACCLDAFVRLSGSLVAPRGFGCAGPRPLFFAPSSALAWAGPGPSASSPAGAAGRD